MAATTKPKGAARGRSNGKAPAGYKRAKVVTLVFDDPEFEGLVARTRRPSIGELFDLTGQAGELDVDVAAMDSGQIEQTKELLGVFAGYLVSWNLRDDVLGDDGEPTGAEVDVPPTLDGLLSQDLGFVVAVFQQWLATMGSVPAPLAQRSPAGVPSAAPEIPMEPLSSSPES